MERILITEELTAFLNSMPVVNVDNIPITHSLIIRDLSKLSLANDVFITIEQPKLIRNIRV